MATDDSYASMPLRLPPGPLAAMDQLQAWARDRVGSWSPPLEVAGHQPELAAAERDNRRLRLVNDALLAVIGLLLDGAGDETVQRLRTALDRVDVRPS